MTVVSPVTVLIKEPLTCLKGFNLLPSSKGYKTAAILPERHVVGGGAAKKANWRSFCYSLHSCEGRTHFDFS